VDSSPHNGPMGRLKSFLIFQLWLKEICFNSNAAQDAPSK
jgi:hypothetical protein